MKNYFFSSFRFYFVDYALALQTTIKMFQMNKN